jgi:hypothetical protein
VRSTHRGGWLFVLALAVGCEPADVHIEVRVPPVLVGETRELEVSVHAAGEADSCEGVAFGAQPPTLLFAVRLSGPGEQPFVGIPRAGRKLVVARLLDGAGVVMGGGCRAVDALEPTSLVLELEPVVTLSAPASSVLDVFGQVTAPGDLALSATAPNVERPRARVAWQLVDWSRQQHGGVVEGDGEVRVALSSRVAPGPFRVECRAAWAKTSLVVSGFAAPRVERTQLPAPITPMTSWVWGRLGPSGERGLAYPAREGGGVELVVVWFEAGALQTARAPIGAVGFALATRVFTAGREEVVVVHRDPTRPTLVLTTVRMDEVGPSTRTRDVPLGMADPAPNARWVPSALLDLQRCDDTDEAWAVQLVASDRSGAAAHLFLDAALRAQPTGPFRAVTRSPEATLVAAGCVEASAGGPRRRALVASLGGSGAQFEVGVLDPGSGRVSVGRWAAANGRLRFPSPTATGLAHVTAALQSGVELSAFRYAIDSDGGGAPFVELARFAAPVTSAAPWVDEDGGRALLIASRGADDGGVLRFIGDGERPWSGDLALSGTALAFADVDGDGVADVVLVEPGGAALSVVRMGAPR